MVDGRLGEHSVVLQLGLTERGAVAGNQDKLSCTRRGEEERQEELSAQGTFSASRSSPRRERRRKGRTLAVAHLLEGGLVAERVLARLDDERETRRDGLGRFGGLALLGGCHFNEYGMEGAADGGGGCLDGALGGDEKCAMSVDAHRIRFKLRLISAVNSVGVR